MGLTPLFLDRSLGVQLSQTFFQPLVEKSILSLVEVSWHLAENKTT